MPDDAESPLGGPLELPGGEHSSKRSSHKHRSTRRVGKKLLIGICALVVLAGLGYVGKKLINSSGDQTKTTSTSKQQSGTNNTSGKPSDVPNNPATKTFKSDVLGLELTYPTSWTVSETTDNGLRVESPEFSYQTTDKGDVAGNFRVYIRKGTRPADSKYIGRGVAIQPSEKLTYIQPTSTQRKDTNLSLFGLDTTDQFAYFLVAGNFQLKKGDTLGPGYGKEPETYIVVGGYSSNALTDDLATNKVPLDSFAQKNAYKQAIEVIKSLKLQ